MCMGHDKPRRNDEEPGWRLERWAPAIKEGDKILFDECGRCQPMVNGNGGIDYHSHHFRLVQNGSGQLRLLVKHGGGREDLPLGYDSNRLDELIAFLPDSDARYLMLHALYKTARDYKNEGRDAERDRWTHAAAEKRIKTRKLPAQGKVKVWIEDPKPNGCGNPYCKLTTSAAQKEAHESECEH